MWSPETEKSDGSDSGGRETVVVVVLGLVFAFVCKTVDLTVVVDVVVVEAVEDALVVVLEDKTVDMVAVVVPLVVSAVLHPEKMIKKIKRIGKILYLCCVFKSIPPTDFTSITILFFKFLVNECYKHVILIYWEIYTK